MDNQSIAGFVAGLNLSVILSVLVGIQISRLRGLNPQNFLERADETAANTIHGAIADLLQSLLEANHLANFRFSPACRSAVALVEKLVEGAAEDLAFLNTVHSSLSTLGVESPYFHRTLDILNALAQNMPPNV